MYVGRSYRWNTSSEKLIALCFTWLSPSWAGVDENDRGVESRQLLCLQPNRTWGGRHGMPYVHD